MLEGTAFGHEAAAMQIGAGISERNEPAYVGTAAGARAPDPGQNERGKTNRSSENQCRAQSRPAREAHEQQQCGDEVQGMDGCPAVEPSIDHDPGYEDGQADD